MGIALLLIFILIFIQIIIGFGKAAENNRRAQEKAERQRQAALEKQVALERRQAAAELRKALSLERELKAAEKAVRKEDENKRKGHAQFLKEIRKTLCASTIEEFGLGKIQAPKASEQAHVVSLETLKKMLKAYRAPQSDSTLPKFQARWVDALLYSGQLNSVIGTTGIKILKKGLLDLANAPDSGSFTDLINSDSDDIQDLIFRSGTYLDSIEIKPYLKALSCFRSMIIDSPELSLEEFNSFAKALERKYYEADAMDTVLKISRLRKEVIRKLPNEQLLKICERLNAGPLDLAHHKLVKLARHHDQTPEVVRQLLLESHDVFRPSFYKTAQPILERLTWMPSLQKEIKRLQNPVIQRLKAHLYHKQHLNPAA